MHAAEQISEITPCSFGYDRKHPVVMYYFAAGVLCGNIFREHSCNTLPTVNSLPNGVSDLSYKINPIRLLHLVYCQLSCLTLFFYGIPPSSLLIGTSIANLDLETKQIYCHAALWISCSSLWVQYTCYLSFDTETSHLKSLSM